MDGVASSDLASPVYSRRVDGNFKIILFISIIIKRVTFLNRRATFIDSKRRVRNCSPSLFSLKLRTNFVNLFLKFPANSALCTPIAISFCFFIKIPSL